MQWYVSCIYCIYSCHVITPLVNSSLYSCVMYRQVIEMVTLNLFIESHHKYIVSIIRVKHILTLHLSTANCRILTTTGCCCKNAAATQCSHYAIYFCLVESIPQLLKLWPMPMHIWVRSSFTILYRNATSYGISVVWLIHMRCQANFGGGLCLDCYTGSGYHKSSLSRGSLRPLQCLNTHPLSVLPLYM